jgi:predicted amidohydrolase YtcJ
MASLGVMAIGQPRYFWDAGDAWLSVLDAARAHRLQPYREMAAAGVRFALSSDAPVASYRPLDTIVAAMTRATVSGAVVGPDQRLTLDEALRAMTIEAAASYHADDDLGSIEEGKLADLVVLDGDVFAQEPRDIAEMRIGLTIVGGDVAYEAERRSATNDSIS